MNLPPLTPPFGPVTGWLAARIRWHLSFIPPGADVFTGTKKQFCWWSVHLCFALPWAIMLAVLRLPETPRGTRPA